MPEMRLETVLNAYPDVPLIKIKLKWCRNKTSKMYKEGFRLCSICGYMIKIDETFCRICNRKFRFKPRSASNLYGLVTESISSPIVFDLKDVLK